MTFRGEITVLVVEDQLDEHEAEELLELTEVGGEEGGDDEDQEEEAALLETRQPGGGAFDVEHSNQDDYQVGGQACGGRAVIN